MKYSNGQMILCSYERLFLMLHGICIFKRALRYLLLKEEWARLTKPRSHRTKKHRAAAMDAKIDSAVHSAVEDYKTQMIKEMRKIMSGS